MDSILSLLKNTISQPPTSERSYSHHLQWNYIVDEFWNRVCLCVLVAFDAAVVQWPGGLSSRHFHCSSCAPGGAPLSGWTSVSFSVREEILLKFFPLSRLIANPWFSNQVTGRWWIQGSYVDTSKSWGVPSNQTDPPEEPVTTLALGSHPLLQNPDRNCDAASPLSLYGVWRLGPDRASGSKYPPWTIRARGGTDCLLGLLCGWCLGRATGRSPNPSGISIWEAEAGRD